MDGIEGLGSFYLGKPYDAAARQLTDGYVLYDSKDLTTHAVCVGMTGSGKTGLCVGAIEEAALDGVPSIVIDPKGDLANLMLTFPALRPEDFRPWINEDDAAKAGVSPDDYARSQAELWAKGLADWGQDGARIQRLRDAADFAIYTPGSDAGLPVSVLGSFAPPPDRSDAEAVGDQIAAIATGLLALLGIDADPIKSREHILLSSLLGAAWANGQALDIPALIAQIQQPPFAKIGVLDLDSFYPQKDRFELALALNNLLAAPGFQLWLQGVPLDAGRLLRSDAGKPRVAIFSIAHLSDAERMFFVTLLLNAVLAWMRGQSGTNSLRALVYMDEIFGYFPPVGEPPSKKPLLTLLKQGRAFGVGVLLATQNPVDLDYKGLSNAGTWLIGRLQTDQDKQRVLDGLEGASGQGGLDRAQLEKLISARQSRLPAQQRARECPGGLPDALDDVVSARPALSSADRLADDAAQGSHAAVPARGSGRCAGRGTGSPGCSRRTRSRRGAGGGLGRLDRAGRSERREPGLPAAAKQRARRRGAGLRADADRRRARAPARREDAGRRSDRERTARRIRAGGRRRRLGLGRRQLRRGRGSRDGAARRSFLPRPAGASAGRKGLRPLVEGLRGLAVPEPDGLALPQPVAEARVTGGRE
ncbi:MAG: hypothetical protein QOC86_2591 [Gaiellales bacterium]|nr:hypothetical protein [Gaiellales bacterium]